MISTYSNQKIYRISFDVDDLDFKGFIKVLRVLSAFSDKLEKYQDLYDKLTPTVKQYRKDILVKYANVKDELSDSDGIVKRPRKLTWLFNYIDKNKDL